MNTYEDYEAEIIGPVEARIESLIDEEEQRDAMYTYLATLMRDL